MEIPIMMIALIAGVLLLVLSLAKVGKTKKTGQVFLVLGIVGLLVAGASYMEYIPQTWDTGSKTVTQTQTVVQTGGQAGKTTTTICAVEDTTVTLSASDKYSAAAAGGSHKYRINGAPALVVADAGTFTASPGDVIEILWQNASKSGSYYSDVSTEVVPCAGTKTFTRQLYANSTLTIEVYNEEGNLIDGSANNETLAAGDVVTLVGKIKGTYQKGVPYGGVIVAEFNRTSVDDVVVEFGGQEVAVPAIYSITLGSEAKTKAYSVPEILSNAILEGKVTIDADDTVNPGTTDDVILTFYPNNYFVNEDNGGSFDGPAAEDEDDASTYGMSKAFTIHAL